MDKSRTLFVWIQRENIKCLCLKCFQKLNVPGTSPGRPLNLRSPLGPLGTSYGRPLGTGTLGRKWTVRGTSCAHWVTGLQKEKTTEFLIDSFSNAVTLLIKNYYFSVVNTNLKQDIGIPMDIYPAAFWANLFP